MQLLVAKYATSFVMIMQLIMPREIVLDFLNL
jgi:hypothetical protein